MESILALRKFVVPEFVFGAGARKLAVRYAQNLKMRKILLVSDSGLQKSGWTSEQEQMLRQAGLDVMPYSQISPNPRDHEIMSGTKMFLDAHCDGMVAVGGGSVIDAAKGIGIVASNGGSILDYEGIDKVPHPMPPLIAIPTTAGTSADISQFAIINDSLRHIKIAIISKSVIPDVALVDPETLATVSPLLAAYTGFDALTHAIEAFVSNASSSITDGHALHAMELLWKYLERAVNNPGDLEAHGYVMMASLTAGMAFSNASLGSVHALAHSLGGQMDLPHGECNSLLLPHVVAYNYLAAGERYDQIGRLWNVDLAGCTGAERCARLVRTLKEFQNRVGIHGGLADRGLTENDIYTLSQHAINDPCNATNPRRPTSADLANILREAL